jgi:hypothetical protein
VGGLVATGLDGLVGAGLWQAPRFNAGQARRAAVRRPVLVLGRSHRAV